MKPRIAATLIGIFCVIIGVTSRKTYEGYQMIRFDSSKNTQNIIPDLIRANSFPSLDFWSDSLVLVPPTLLQPVQQIFKDQKVNFTIHVEDAQKLIRSDDSCSKCAPSPTWKCYNRVYTIHRWMNYLAKTYPKRAKVWSIGKSTEGRQLKIIRITEGAVSGKPAIFIASGEHAREWIGPATTTYFINKLVQGMSAKDRWMVEKIVWYFIPVVNPDGYEYSHVEERLWRKTRSRHNGDECLGVDPNRNFDYHWGEVGASEDPCSDTYAGPYALSEPEMVAIQNVVDSLKSSIKLYMDFHSYCQCWLTAYGFTKTYPADYKDQKDLADRAVAALKKMRGTTYKVGPSSRLLNQIGGGFRDWVKDIAKIKYSFVVELPGGEDGTYGFLLPPSEIIHVGTETWEAIKVVAKQVVTEFPPSRKTK